MINTLCIEPNWPAPKNIRAFSTLRHGGISPTPFKSLNLGLNTNDYASNILENRRILQKALQLPSEPIWLKQIHSRITLPAMETNREVEADASYTHTINKICAVLTADCLPILLCDLQGTFVSAIHAGWRGLQKQIIDATLDNIPCAPQDMLVWLGPAIGPTCFEVGDDVRDLFIAIDKSTEMAFTPSENNRYLCDIYAIAKLQFNKRGITQIYGGEYCTYSDPNKFYSYRRDGANTGRMASLIWINGN